MCSFGCRVLRIHQCGPRPKNFGDLCSILKVFYTFIVICIIVTVNFVLGLVPWTLINLSRHMSGQTDQHFTCSYSLPLYETNKKQGIGLCIATQKTNSLTLRNQEKKRYWQYYHKTVAKILGHHTDHTK